MALLYADSFDHYGVDATGRLNMMAGQWASITSTCYPSATYKRTGDNSLRVRGVARLSTQGEKAILGVGFGALMAELPALGRGWIAGITFYDQSSNGILAVTIMPDGALRIVKGGPQVSDANVIAITDSVFTAGTFNHIETKITVDDIVGALEIRFNGKVVAQLLDLDLGTAGIASIQWQNEAQGNSTGDMYLDDVLVWDTEGDFNNDFVGPYRVLTRYPAGDTAEADWTVTGAGNGYQAINQTVPDGDTTYIGTDTVSNVSEFSLPELPSELASIAGVFIPAMGKSDEAGISEFKVSIVSNGQALAGVAHALTPEYSYFRDSFDYDPNTDAAWTKSGFEAALIRVEKTA